MTTDIRASDLELPDYLRKPQYQTREQQKVLAAKKHLSEISKAFMALQESNKSILEMIANLVDWKPKIDTMVDSVYEEIGELR